MVDPRPETWPRRRQRLGLWISCAVVIFILLLLYARTRHSDVRLVSEQRNGESVSSGHTHMGSIYYLVGYKPNDKSEKGYLMLILHSTFGNPPSEEGIVAQTYQPSTTEAMASEIGGYPRGTAISIVPRGFFNDPSRRLQALSDDEISALIKSLTKRQIFHVSLFKEPSGGRFGYIPGWERATQVYPPAAPIQRFQPLVDDWLLPVGSTSGFSCYLTGYQPEDMPGRRYLVVPAESTTTLSAQRILTMGFTSDTLELVAWQLAQAINGTAVWIVPSDFFEDRKSRFWPLTDEDSAELVKILREKKVTDVFIYKGPKGWKNGRQYEGREPAVRLFP